MDDGTDENRILAACEECGSTYAAVALRNGDIQPIGSRSGCTTCGETAFVPLTGLSDGAEADESDD